MTARRSGWRKRTWVYVLWTVIAFGAAVWFAADAPPHVSAEENWYALWYVLIFFAWSIVVVATWAVGLLRDEVRHRREMRAIGKSREGEPRKF